MYANILGTFKKHKNSDAEDFAILNNGLKTQKHADRQINMITTQQATNRPVVPSFSAPDKPKTQPRRARNATVGVMTFDPMQ
jgi:hypothetical protein